MLNPDSRFRLIDRIGNPVVARSVAVQHVAELQSSGLTAPLEETSSRLGTKASKALSQSPAWIAWSPLMSRSIRLRSHKARAVVSARHSVLAANFIKNPAHRQDTASADILKAVPCPAGDAGLGILHHSGGLTIDGQNDGPVGIVQMLHDFQKLSLNVVIG